MAENHAKSFAAALGELEASDDVDGFVEHVFTDDAELLRPEADQQVNGIAGARQFWQRYLEQFDEIRSDFSRVTQHDDVGLLEWTSTGKLRGGRDITYRGVSVLDFDDDGRVRRFATYYDTAPFGLPG